MNIQSVIFNDSELDLLLASKKNIQSAKKSLILYFFTLPGLDKLVDIIYLPESILEDFEFTNSIRPFFNKIGISVSPKIINEKDSLEYFSNPLPIISSLNSKYKFSGVHYPINFGKRLIQKSPKYDEYIIHSQYNWTNVHLIYDWTQKNNIQLLVEPNLFFQENSSEDFYIHMRQILWEGIDIFRKLNTKFNKIKIIIQPFYPKLKGLRDNDILDSANIASTTLRCITECLTKEKMEILLKSCKEFTIHSYNKYIKHYKTYNKDNTINYLITTDCFKEYLKNWDFQEKNLKETQSQFILNLELAPS